MEAIQYSERLRSDFDKIARLPRESWGHNSHYHAYLLRQLPAVCGDAVDVGCGSGDFVRLLAPRARSVLGIDLSAEMIRQANEQSAGIGNVRYVMGDFMSFPIADGSVDAITSIATLHHVPLEPALRQLSRWLKPGGRLVVLDLFVSGYGADLAWKVPAKAVSAMLSWRYNGRLRESRAAREAWKQHAESEQHMLRLGAIREIAEAVLPGAILKRHLLWRYSLVWTKPA